ncbi:hypothetical protein [Micromonospora sp. WMMD1082]|uniref:hypothetical protein n=1 Tax=Micromonospora sp. WMMD1082 TaxID=3016104 RepID=UPI002415F7A6|nr:hypothetical protein [Micromonospora sp. WMMD1082]MDG4795732.1 hypothetical protein [Micromonospora sp. WMMD1082]
MPGENTPIVINHEMINGLGVRLKNAAIGADNVVMYGTRFVDEHGATLPPPSEDRVSETDHRLGPAAPLPVLDRVRVAAGTADFTAGAEVARSVANVAPVVFSRMTKLRDRLDRYGFDLDAFLAENANLEDLNQVTAASLQEHVTFYEITDEGAGR